MTANDFFYVSLGSGFLVLTVCMVLITVQISGILKDIKKVTGTLSEITDDVATLKDGIQIAILKLVQKVLEKSKKGGGLIKSNDK